jgi:four helix bundle protein
MVAVKDVSELRVYQHALKLYPEITEFIELVPLKFFKLRHQLSNSSEAIPPLIAEGYAKKRNIVEFRRFIEMAMAESDELVTHLRMLKTVLKFCPRIQEENCKYFIEEYIFVSKELNNLMKNWNKYSL